MSEVIGEIKGFFGRVSLFLQRNFRKYTTTKLKIQDDSVEMDTITDVPVKSVVDMPLEASDPVVEAPVQRVFECELSESVNSASASPVAE